MREYVFSLIHTLPYKDRIFDFVLILENTGQWKPVFSNISADKYNSWQLSLISVYKTYTINKNFTGTAGAITTMTAFYLRFE